ncbi:MAG: caspase family protein [Fimbriimonadaceae bacterium]
MRRIFCIVLASVAALGGAQQWSSTYDAGLTAARALKWMDARSAFKQAAAFRTDDVATPTTLPGPVTERRTWRNGSPYSPNFLAAYAGFKASDALSGEDRSKLLKDVCGEFETILSKNQLSAETFFFLNNVYVQLAETEKRLKLEERLTSTNNKLTWKVDLEPVTPEDQSAVNAAFQRSVPIVSPPSVSPKTGQGTGAGAGTTTTTNPTQAPIGGGTPLASFSGRVPTIATKYALIVGNSESRIQDVKLPFASDSAQALRESLVSSCGYPEANIELVLNATRDQMLSTAKALAERMPKGSTVFVYFAGVGSNLDGKDYLAGVDSASLTESGSMLSKRELYTIFNRREASVFAFFEVNRPSMKGRIFGTDTPDVGPVSQMQGTSPEKEVYSTVHDGKEIGLFTYSLVSLFSEVRSNQIPIMEFGWKVFDKIRTIGGGGKQTPTLPGRTGLDPAARF